jgi:hypothetical protein
MFNSPGESSPAKQSQPSAKIKRAIYWPTQV